MKTILFVILTINISPLFSQETQTFNNFLNEILKYLKDDTAVIDSSAKYILRYNTNCPFNEVLTYNQAIGKVESYCTITDNTSITKKMYQLNVQEQYFSNFTETNDSVVDYQFIHKGFYNNYSIISYGEKYYILTMKVILQHGGISSSGLVNTLFLEKI